VDQRESVLCPHWHPSALSPPRLAATARNRAALALVGLLWRGSTKGKGRMWGVEESSPALRADGGELQSPLIWVPSLAATTRRRCQPLGGEPRLALANSDEFRAVVERNHVSSGIDRDAQIDASN
jgi:hypothetical protein